MPWNRPVNLLDGCKYIYRIYPRKTFKFTTWQNYFKKFHSVIDFKHFLSFWICNLFFIINIFRIFLQIIIIKGWYEIDMNFERVLFINFVSILRMEKIIKKIENLVCGNEYLLWSETNLKFIYICLYNSCLTIFVS